MPPLPPVRSIRTRMIVLFIVVITTTLGAFASHRHWLLRQDLEQRFERTRADVLESLAQSLAEPTWALNVGILRTRLDATLIHPEVVEACVFSPDGQEIYAAAGRPASPNGEPCASAGADDLLDRVVIYPPDGIDATRREVSIGKAVVRFSRRPMDGTLRAAMIQGVTEVAAIDVVLVLLLTFGLRMIFVPLERLQRALFQLASRHEEEPEELAKLGRQEFDSVIDGFNQVLRKLKLIIAERTEAELTVRAAIQRSNNAFAQIQATQAELVEKNRQLETLSRTDQLTGVYNRRRLDEALIDALAHSGTVFSIILLDVDRFKSINDNHGHQIGDRVLVDMAQRILDAKRPGDIVGRWGGEEFLIICPDTDLPDAAAQAEALRQAISAQDFSVMGAMTASLGVASFQSGDTIHGMISRADQALYEAKRKGRNRVEFGEVGVLVP
ncbi:GGDEF domain-containing protein [Cupriavidus sp. SW-Y-13]|uniref:GGDEF domain-containing protein n=1 Tax=Cupriavidus sp. SW-Y-13 TaxID=2653854 RepID=UPI00136627BE|nr:GGDEF domain-containing protein [Cupriavidus sp. SW-Y-13]MWL87668.1 diguanylate cyclase [Cupriavidus sp. SW-Y-13]